MTARDHQTAPAARPRTHGGASALLAEAALPTRLQLSARSGSDNWPERCLCRRETRAVQTGRRSTCFSPKAGMSSDQDETRAQDDLRERRPRKSRLPHTPPEAGSQQEPSATRSIAAPSQSPRGSPEPPLVPVPAWGFPGLTEALKAHNRRREPDFSLWSRRPGAAGSGRAADEAAIRPASGRALRGLLAHR